jgi:hypothetical protein
MAIPRWITRNRALYELARAARTLAGAVETLPRWRPKLAVAVEHTPQPVEECALRPQSCKGFGHRYSTLAEIGSMRWRINLGS